MDQPIISIVVLAYNLEKYIDHCIESLVNQQCNQAYEIVIGEDFSTDETSNICLQWQEKYPDLIRVLIRPANLGMSANFADTVKATKGKYIAFCEGDDFWIDGNKLQLQYDYLEANLSVGLVHTNFNMIQESGLYINKLNKNHPSGKVLHQLLEYSFIATLTVMIRKEVLEQALTDRTELILHNGKAIDYPLWLTCATFTEIAYLHKTTSTYRVMGESASHSKDINKQIAYQTVNRDLALSFQREFFPNDKLLQRTIFNTYYYVIMREAIRSGNKKSVWGYYKKIISNNFLQIFNPKIGYFLLRGLVG